MSINEQAYSWHIEIWLDVELVQCCQPVEIPEKVIQYSYSSPCSCPHSARDVGTTSAVWTRPYTIRPAPAASTPASGRTPNWQFLTSMPHSKVSYIIPHRTNSKDVTRLTWLWLWPLSCLLHVFCPSRYPIMEPIESIFLSYFSLFTGACCSQGFARAVLHHLLVGAHPTFTPAEVDGRVDGFFALCARRRQQELDIITVHIFYNWYI